MKMQYKALNKIIRLLFLPLYLVVPISAIASVPVVDEYQAISDANAISNYLEMVKSSLTTLSQTSDQISQVAQLDDLMAQEQKLADQCNKYCNADTSAALDAALKTVNDEIVQNFNKFSGMVSTSISNIAE